MTHSPGGVAVTGLVRLAEQGALSADELTVAAQSVLQEESSGVATPHAKETLRRISSFELALDGEEERLNALLIELNRFAELLDAPPSDDEADGASEEEVTDDTSFASAQLLTTPTTAQQLTTPTTAQVSSAAASSPTAPAAAKPRHADPAGSGKKQKGRCKGLPFGCTGLRVGCGGRSVVRAQTCEITSDEIRILAPPGPPPAKCDQKRRRAQLDPLNGAALAVLPLCSITHGWEADGSVVLQKVGGSCLWLESEPCEWGNPIVRALRAHDKLKGGRVQFTPHMPPWARGSTCAVMPPLPAGPLTWPLWNRTQALLAYVLSKVAPDLEDVDVNTACQCVSSGVEPLVVKVPRRSYSGMEVWGEGLVKEGGQMSLDIDAI